MANSQTTVEVRLYRDGTLINTCTLNNAESAAGTQTIPISGTFVDTAFMTGVPMYQVRVIFTQATNVTSATAYNSNLNAILFE
jgi:hypothetical protein